MTISLDAIRDVFRKKEERYHIADKEAEIFARALTETTGILHRPTAKYTRWDVEGSHKYEIKKTNCPNGRLRVEKENFECKEIDFYILINLHTRRGWKIPGDFLRSLHGKHHSGRWGDDFFAFEPDLFDTCMSASGEKEDILRALAK